MSHKKPILKNRVIDLAVENPALGQLRVSQNYNKEALCSPQAEQGQFSSETIWNLLKKT
jgi:hypothetical protein